MHYDVLLFGDYWYDLIFTGLPHLPELGHAVHAGGFDNVPGGVFINAVALRRLGLRVGWAADFGSDPFSRLVIEAARREGLDDSLFRYHDRPYRRVTAAASLPADRSFISYADPEPAFSAPLRALLRHTARAVMIPGLVYGPLFDGGRRWARLRQMKIVMDPHRLGTHTLAEPAIRRVVRHVDVFLPNALEARQLTGAPTTLEALQRLGEACPLVVIKEGAQGAYARQGGETFHAPAIPVKVVDTTGAGDCFAAGFLRAWLDGRPISECLRWGNICGGLSATARGGPTAAPTLAEVEGWLAQHGAGDPGRS